MKHYVRLLTAAAALTLALTAAAPAYAVDTYDTTVTTSVDPTYMITIPPQVDFGVVSKGMEAQIKDFDVTIEEAVMEFDATVTVTVSSPFTMLDEDGAGENALPYELYNGADASDKLADGDVYAVFKSGTADAGQTAIADGTATVSGRVVMDPADIVYAGKYSGTMTFTCEYAKGA